MRSQYCFMTVYLQSPSDTDCKYLCAFKKISANVWNAIFLERKIRFWMGLAVLATSCEELTHWKRLGCWEGLGAGGEGDDRG